MRTLLPLLLPIHRDERGALNMAALILWAIGMVFLAVGFVVLPNILTATNAILAYAFATNTAIVTACFTGLSSITGITPLIILVGFLAVAVISGFMGLKVMREGASVKFSPASILLLGISLIFLSVGLTIFPVVLDGVSTVWHGSGEGISATYTGFQTILIMAPMLVLISYIAASVLTGMFGLKSLGASAQ